MKYISDDYKRIGQLTYTNSCIIKFIIMPWSLSTSYLTIVVMRIKIIYIALKYVSLFFFPFQVTNRTQIQRKQPKVLSLKNKLENSQIFTGLVFKDNEQSNTWKFI